MAIDPSRALSAYAAVTTLLSAGLLLGSARAPDPTARFSTLEVERINIREPDGTLRMAIASHARMPGIVVGDREYRHPDRPEAGMIFYDDEGVENGGLVFSGGRRRDGQPTNSGSLTFDRYRQDQTVQVLSSEDGDRREAGLVVNDRPDGPMNLGALSSMAAMPPGAARDRALARANIGGTQRVFIGRRSDGQAMLVMRDQAGRPRLRLTVDASGPEIAFLDISGKPTRTIR